MSSGRILVVDDDPQIRRAMKATLTSRGYEVSDSRTGEEALDKVRSETFDLVLLDVNMPGIGGLETLKRIRQAAMRLPVLMLTVRDEEEDKVKALDLGADDYVTKPFSTPELIARIRAAVRRFKAPARATDAPIEIGEIRLEPVKRTVTKRGQTLHLTRKEFDILHCLMSRAGRAITYGKLLAAVWGGDAREEIEYLRTYVNQLRKKIEDDPSKPTYLLTDVYVGYRFVSADMFAPEDESGMDASASAMEPQASEGMR